MPNSLLLQQWRLELVKYFGESNIGEYWGEKKDLRAITIFIINTGCSETFEGGEITSGVFWQQFGFIIYDECQMYATKKFHEIFWRAQTPYIMGLSATPDGSIDSFNEITPLFLGEIIDIETIPGCNVTSNDYPIELWIKPHINDEFTYSFNSQGNINYASVIETIISDQRRNELIVDYVWKFISDPERNVFVFSERRRHVECLAQMLASKYDVGFRQDGDAMICNTNVIMGGATAQDVATATSSRLILTTYAFSSVGLSVKQMNTLILGTPKRSGFKQIIGRIMRHGSNTKTRVVVDIFDKSAPLRNQAYGRKRDIIDAYNPKIIVKKPEHK